MTTCAWCHTEFEPEDKPLDIKRGKDVIARVHEGCIATYAMALKGVNM